MRLASQAMIAAMVARCDLAAAQCADVPTFDQGLSPTRQLHVSTSGSNTTGNGTSGNPYATIAFAAAQATPGTAVIVHAGTYTGGGFITSVSGTATGPIWVGGAPGEARPVIEGGSEGLHLVKPRYVVVHDLEVGNAAGFFKLRIDIVGLSHNLDILVKLIF